RDHGPHMGQGAVPYMGDQGVTPDQVGQKNIGDQKGDQKENGPFQYPFANLLPGPWGAVQTDLCPPIPIDPIFDPAENHFHKDGLWADPPTEDPAKGHREKGEQHNGDDQGNGHQVKILGPKGQPEQVEAPLQDIEQHELVPIDLDKGGQDQEYQEGVTDVLTVSVQPATGFLGEDPRPFAIL